MNRFEDRPLVYLAMKLSCGGRCGPVEYLHNVGSMVREAVDLWHFGYPCYVPCLDLLMAVVGPGMQGQCTVPSEWFYLNSLAVQRRCDVLYIPCSEVLADGVLAEYNQALRDGQPVVRSFAGLAQVQKDANGKWVVKGTEE